MSTSPVIALVHATSASLAPVTAAFERDFPQADLWHLLDDRLDRDAAAAGGLTPPLAERMRRLVQYAVDADASAVQLACSMYAPVADQVSHPVPVVASDRAMFEEVARLRPSRALVLASLPPAGTDSSARLRALLEEDGQRPELTYAVAEAARPAALAGDRAALTRALVDAARAAGQVDVVALAQYSLSPVADEVADVLGVPVLSGPRFAATGLAARLQGGDA